MCVPLTSNVVDSEQHGGKLVARSLQVNKVIAACKAVSMCRSTLNPKPSCTGVEDARAREKAELLARDIIEYLDSINYNKYYDAMGRPGSRGGNREKQFSDFSVRAVDAAQARSAVCPDASCVRRVGCPARHCLWPALGRVKSFVCGKDICIKW